MNVRPCALIVEDELFVALDLEDAMVEMGFYVCGVAATQDRAYSLAASEQPDVVLMDVCLQGGQEGIEAARCLREACRAEWCSSPAILIGRPWSASTRKCLGRLC